MNGKTTVINMKKFRDGQHGSLRFEDWNSEILETFEDPCYEDGRDYQIFIPRNPHVEGFRPRRSCWRVFFDESGITVEKIGRFQNIYKDKVTIWECLELVKYVSDFYNRLINNGFIITNHKGDKAHG